MRKVSCFDWPALGVSLALAAIVAGCASLPAPQGREPSIAMPDTADTRLGRAVIPAVAANPGKSGIYAIPDPRDAFAARVLLAAAAERSLDAQYYLWHGDQVGYLLFEALWQAAQRGVRVRLLLDDLNTGGLDATIATLAAQPNIEVRLYNPLVPRGARALSFLTDFARVNRRMHNKSFTADNQAAIVGGRNIGNEYFAAGAGLAYADLDVLATGPVVRAISAEFDLYWNSASAYAARDLVGPGAPNGVAQLRDKLDSVHADPESVAYLDAVRATPIVRQLLDRALQVEWTTARVVYDDPGKTREQAGLMLLPQLVAMMGPSEHALDLVSPYFVPGDGGTAALVAAAARGVKVRILTNSLASTDAPIVHAGYGKRRRDLLRAGIVLYEMKPTAQRNARDVDTGSHGASGLHAKTFAVDRGRIFVGSFNLDQRSAHLNTEMGVIIDDPALATRLAAAFDSVVSRIAYEVQLSPDGINLVWIEQTPSGVTRYDVEPDTSWFLRSRVDMLSILSIDWLL